MLMHLHVCEGILLLFTAHILKLSVNPGHGLALGHCFKLSVRCMSLYEKRGVSAQKEEVHAATQNIEKGLYPRAFCKVYKDVLGGQEDWVNVLHADGAGTKSIIAYLYWKETGDISVWSGIAQDAIVMNLDDLLCVGITDHFIFSSSIDRNKKRIPGAVLQALIEGTQQFFDTLKGAGCEYRVYGWRNR
jgi:phosphoribosylformylglycinamidine cyclo-ligase